MPRSEKPDRSSGTRPNPSPAFLSLPRSRSGTTSSLQSVNSVATLSSPTGTVVGSTFGSSTSRSGGFLERHSGSGLGQDRRPSLLSLHSLSGSGPTSSGAVSRTSVRGVESRSRSTPLTAAKKGSWGGSESEARGEGGLVISPWETPREIAFDEDDDDAIDGEPDSPQSLLPGIRQRSPSEQALLRSLEAGIPGTRQEEHTLRTFVDSRRPTQSPEGIRGGLAEQRDGSSPTAIPPATPVSIVSNPDGLHTGDDRMTGDELSKSIGRHSVDTFRTARATPMNGSVREKQVEVPTASADEIVTGDEEEMGMEQDGRAAQKEERPAEGSSSAGIVWRLGTWVYSSMPTIRGGAAPSADGSQAVREDDVALPPVEETLSTPALEPIAPASEAGGPMIVDSSAAGSSSERVPDTTTHDKTASEILPQRDLEPDERNRSKEAVSSWGDTFRWRKSALPESIPGPPPTITAVSGESPAVSTQTGKSNEAAPCTEAVPEPNAAPSETTIESGRQVDETVVDQQGWASYFRPKPTRDPLIAALSQKETAKSDLDGAVPEPTLAVATETDPPAGLLPEGDPTQQRQAIDSSDPSTGSGVGSANPSRWWFGRSASTTLNRDKVKAPAVERLGEARPASTLPILPGDAPVGATKTVEPDHLTPASSTPHARSERRSSVVSRKNLVLPSWSATFGRPPRAGTTPVTNVSMDTEEPDSTASLPRTDQDGKACWDGIRRVVIIGVHGWFPNTHIQKVVGAPRTSGYFCSMMGQSVLAAFEDAHGVGEDQLDKLTYIPLDGEGSIEERAEKLYKVYLSKPEWVADVKQADAVFVAAHSQGCIVAAHLLARILESGHISIFQQDDPAEGPDRGAASRGPTAERGDQSSSKLARVALLSMCGVHLGPFYNSATSTVITPYLWFEHPSARELFDFQDTSSRVSEGYQHSLRLILDHGVKVLLLSSLDDQMVPIYSASFSAARHPRLLRALYVDSSISPSHDFILNLIILGMMVLNAGLDDQGLISHLSEATAGAWRGVGHSTPYEDPGAYDLAVSYLLKTSNPRAKPLEVESFGARDVKNDYELPWILRGVMDDPTVQELFRAEIKALKDTVLSWQPNTRSLREIKKRLEPMAGRAAIRLQQRTSRLQPSPSAVSLHAGTDSGGEDPALAVSAGVFLIMPSRCPYADSHFSMRIGLNRDW